MPKFLVLSRNKDYTFQNRVSNSIAGQSLFRSLAINQHHHSIESNPLIVQSSIFKRFIIASSNIKPNFTFVAFAKQDIDYPVENKGGRHDTNQLPKLPPSTHQVNQRDIIYTAIQLNNISSSIRLDRTALLPPPHHRSVVNQMGSKGNFRDSVAIYDARRKSVSGCFARPMPGRNRKVNLEGTSFPPGFPRRSWPKNQLRSASSHTADFWWCSKATFIAGADAVCTVRFTEGTEQEESTSFHRIITSLLLRDDRAVTIYASSRTSGWDLRELVVGQYEKKGISIRWRKVFFGWFG